MARRVDAGAEARLAVRPWRPDDGSVPPSTAVANLDSEVVGHVDARGLVTPRPDGWSLDWWVRSAERWHVPADARPSTVTQRLVDAAPVVETSVRIPDGTAVQRTWCTRSGADEWLVVEVENASAAPVAVALAIRPANPSGSARIGRIRFVERVVEVDGRPALVLSRAPSRVAVPAADGTDSACVVLADGGDEQWPGDVVDPAGAAQAAFVFPLAHTARLRVAVPLGAAATVDVGGLPDADRVANGWRSHTSPPGALRLELPDERLGEAVASARAALLVAHGQLAVDEALPVLAALDRHGLHGRVGAVLASYPAQARLDGSFRGLRGDATAPAVWSLGDHWRLTRDGDLAEAAMGAAAKGAHRLARRRSHARAGALGPAAQLAAADLLDGAGQPDAAARCRELAARRVADVAASTAYVPWSVADGPTLQARLDRATPTWTWPGEDPVAAAAALLLDVRDVLVHEAGDATAPVLALAPSWPDEWLGQGVEVHGAPTWWGRLSYAVRWHGARPALLWELDAHPGVASVRLSAPRLDPGWSSTEPRGEALLAPVEPAGGLPGVVRPLAGGTTPAATAPDGGTFS